MNHNWFANDFIIVVHDFWLESSIIIYSIPFFLFLLSFKNSFNLAYARLLRVCYDYSDLSRIISTKNWKSLAKSAVAKLHCGITKREQYFRFAHEYIQSRRTVYVARLYILHAHIHGWPRAPGTWHCTNINSRHIENSVTNKYQHTNVAQLKMHEDTLEYCTAIECGIQDRAIVYDLVLSLWDDG